MEVLGLIGYSMFGAIFWVVNVEAIATYYGATRGWNPLLIGVILATGQNLTYIILYFCGDQLLKRWHAFRVKIERARAKLEHITKTRFLWLTALGSITGLPPAVAMPVIAPGFKVTLIQWLPVTFSCRVVRFAVLAWTGDSIYTWWNAL